MATVQPDGSILCVETDRTSAAVQTEGYVSGVKGGSFVDKSTGARDQGFGLCIVDFLLETGHDDDSTPPALRYHGGNLVHGHIPKRYVELPQICTQAKQLTTEIVEGDGFYRRASRIHVDSCPPTLQTGLALGAVARVSRWRPLVPRLR